VVTVKLLIVNKREAISRKDVEVAEKAFQRWLQTVYPVMVADNCIFTYGALSSLAEKFLDDEVRALIKSGRFERPSYIGDLWASDTSLTIKLAE
jgi:hypothetical protein